LTRSGSRLNGTNQEHSSFPRCDPAYVNAEVPLRRFKKAHPALKHAAYSATTLLPGEDPVAFENLRRRLIAEFGPVGALEEHIVIQIAHLLWRKQNLAIFRIASRAIERFEEIKLEKMPELKRVVISLDGLLTKQLKLDPKYEAQQKAEQEARWRAEQEREKCEEEAQRQRYREAEEQGRQELGDAFELVAIGKPATIEGLMQELNVMEPLDALISKYIKQLLMVRGIKSLSSNSSSAEIPQLERPLLGCDHKLRLKPEISQELTEAGADHAMISHTTTPYCRSRNRNGPRSAQRVLKTKRPSRRWYVEHCGMCSVQNDQLARGRKLANARCHRSCRRRSRAVETPGCRTELRSDS
jgi:hypothetical protein